MGFRLLWVLLLAFIPFGLSAEEDDACQPFEEDFERVEQYMEDHLWSVARARLEMILEEAPDCFRARVELGRIPFFQRAYEEALSYFEELAGTFPGRHHPHHYRGLIFYEQGSETSALTAFHQAFEADPTLGSGYFFRTVVPLLESGEEILTDKLEILKTRHPGLAAPHVTHGLTYYFDENYTAALPHFEAAIRTDRTHEGAWYYAAKSYENIGEDLKALNAYNQAIALNGEYKAAYFGRGMIRISRGNWNRGCADLRTADRLDHAGASPALQNFCRRRFY